MINNILTSIFYLLNVPAYYISGFIKRKENIWIFGAWDGKRYSDNSKHLYEYIIKNTKVKGIWLTKNNEIIKALRNAGCDVHHVYSILGYYYSMTAKILIVSSSFRDINRFAIKGAISINLWHAINLKKICCDISEEYCYKCRPKGINYSYFKYLLFPFMRENYNYVLASSNKSAKTIKTAFCLEKSQVIISGLPRTDVLKSKGKNAVYNILYLPTFRDHSQINLFENFNVNKMSSFFKQNKMIFSYNLHFADKSTYSFNNEYLVRLDPNDDIYEKMSETDLLITDYSSVYFDFCLTNRPIIFSPFDIDIYNKINRQFYYNYMDVTPGPKCYDWDEVLEQIKIFYSGKDLYKEERKSINKIFNSYTDFENRKRITAKIFKAL